MSIVLLSMESKKTIKHGGSMTQTIQQELKEAIKKAGYNIQDATEFKQLIESIQNLAIVHNKYGKNILNDLMEC